MIGRMVATQLRPSLLLVLFALVGCSQPPQPPSILESHSIQTAEGARVDYRRDVKPILDHRCVVCHGCYDAPCQLNLSAFEGIERGAHKLKVYDSSRLRLADPTRLFEDARSVAEWRQKGFFPVMPEQPHTTTMNRHPGIMARLLALKQAHPLPSVSPLDTPFDFSLDRHQQCPTEAQVDDFAHDYPLSGMPYGLPGLTDHEHHTLMRWIEAGAPYQAEAPLSSAYEERTRDWEMFLN